MEVDHADRDCARRRCRDYLLALEEERRKIQVFQRELPLCFDLVTRTIEGMRSQMDGAGSEETVSDQGPPPVLEEFIPLKPSLSLSSSEEESTHAGTAKAGKKEEAETSERHSSPPPPPPVEAKKVTPDWLQSVQLWSQEEPQNPSSPSPTLAKDLPCKPVALNARKPAGAFQPFEKEKRAELPASSTTAAASSTVVGDRGDKPIDDDTEKHMDTDKDNKDAKDKDKDREGQSQPHRKPRRCWAPELHHRFLQALQQLGGSRVATPKQIRELMKVDGLTNDEVKSHLQKYRLHTRRPSSTGQSSAAAGVAAPPAPQFVVVGSIWVPPPEYAAAAAAQQHVQLAAAGNASGSANPVYAPVAMLPAGLQPNSHRNRKQQQQGQRHSGSEGLRSGDAGDGSSSSPAVSSSSQTTSD